ncbi:MAG: LacI family DNA-binding transcriptional regulator [Bacteroidota bacterium]|nr:LacI family DNA-binding transcriptional regulator [Bacteroidota bacterium]MDP4206667.1 LacI family DNA-binding transcriptional regulator [Bacteroidota bacterium]
MKTPNEERKIVRIKDIAAKANVSTGTVDRVLHNRGRVSEEVKQRVLQIIQEFEYEPNIHARALVSNRIYRIAVIIPDPAIDDYWQAPKTGIEKAEKELKQYGITITLFIFNSSDANTFKQMANNVTADAFDGVLIAPIFYRESLTYFSLWKRTSLPFILFNTHIPDYEPLSYIGQDSYQSGYLAGKLFHFGHPEPSTFLITHIDEDVPNSSHLIKKEQGFVDYYAQNTTPGTYNILTADVKGSTNQSVFHTQLDELLKTNPEIKGIFVTNSRAHTIADYLAARQITHIHLIGYDLLEKNLNFLNKGIINFLINQNPMRQGYYGIQLLADYLVFKKEVSAIKYLPLDIITKENLHYYIEAEKY